MKEFIAFVKKEFLHIFRDKRSLLILFAIPVVQLLLFGFALRNEIKDIPMGVLNLSNDNISNEFLHKLESSGYFRIIKNFNSEEEFYAAFKEGNIKEILVIDKDFTKNLYLQKKASIQLILDGSDPNYARQIKTYTNSILNDFTNKYYPDHSILNISMRLLFNPELKSVFTFIPGLTATILMLLSAFMTSISITREKELGTMEILLVSPLNPLQIILGKVFPYIILSFINAVIIIVFGIFVFGMPVVGNFSFLFFATIIFITSSLSLGLFFSSITDSQQVAMLLSLVGLMLPTMLLSDFVFPVASMPKILQIISNIIPAKWYVSILKGVMLKGLGLSSLYREMIILTGMTIFLLIISLKKFKIRL